MIEELVSAVGNTSTLSVGQIAVRLAVSFGLSVVISVLYRVVTTRKVSRTNMLPSLIFMAVTISTAIMLIGDNLARSFGLVGAVSIIRFRTAVRSPLDMAFIFLVIVMGMACGLGLFKIALTFFVLITVIILVIWKLGVINNTPSFVAEFTYDENSANREDIESELSSRGFAPRLLSLHARKARVTVSYSIKLPFGEMGDLLGLFKEPLARRTMSVKILTPS